MGQLDLFEISGLASFGNLFEEGYQTPRCTKKCVD